MKSNALTIVVGLVAVVALVIGFVALNQAKTAQLLALSEIVVDEVNSLTTPILSEETNTYSFLAMYDISITNMSGPTVTLTSVKKSTTGAGFLALLDGENIVTVKVNEKAFMCEYGSSAIKANPRLLKTIAQQDMGDEAAANLTMNSGETKVLHVGVILEPYSAENQTLARMALVSFELEFDNGKSFIFQRGFPIYPVK